MGQAQHALKESSRTVVNVTTSAEEFDHQALVERAVRQRIAWKVSRRGGPGSTAAVKVVTSSNRDDVISKQEGERQRNDVTEVRVKTDRQRNDVSRRSDQQALIERAVRTVVRQSVDVNTGG